jgi:uncharacterized protein YndB with AHSA1/START domain
MATYTFVVKWLHFIYLLKTSAMTHKTIVESSGGQQDVRITRTFDLPVELLFRAYEDPELVEKWMHTKVLKLENRTHGSYTFETTSQQGDVLFRANGVIHQFVPGRKIVRTFEMENTPFGAQLEFLEFEKLTADTSRLNMHVIYRSEAERDQVLHIGIGLEKGINLAHNKLEEITGKLK